MSYGTGAMAAGGGIAAVGALMQGQSTASTLNQQANIQRNNATQSIIASKLNADRQSIMSSKAIGRISSGYSASGVALNSGSVFAVIGASAANAELDRQNILYGGEIRAVNYENQASIDEKGASNALSGSYFNALASIVGAGGKIGSQYVGGSSGSVNPIESEESGYSSEDIDAAGAMDVVA